MEESFLYDDLNRLTTITMNGVNTGHMSYDALDPMTDKRTDGHDVFLTARHDYVNPEGQLRPPCCMQRDDGRFCYGDKDRRDGRGSIHPNQKEENITKTVILAVAVAALAALLLVGCQEGGLQRTIFSKGERNSHTCPN